MIGYDNLFESLRNLGQPTRPLLISLLELVCQIVTQILLVLVFFKSLGEAVGFLC